MLPPIQSNYCIFNKISKLMDIILFNQNLKLLKTFCRKRAQISWEFLSLISHFHRKTH